MHLTRGDKALVVAALVVAVAAGSLAVVRSSADGLPLTLTDAARPTDDATGQPTTPGDDVAIVGVDVASPALPDSAAPAGAASASLAIVDGPDTSTGASTATTAASPGEADGPRPDGLLTFRGNATRTLTGWGPIGMAAADRWAYPGRAMCATSRVGDEEKQWCGSGWTGQPAVFERDGRTWVVVGTYDRHIHFIDGDSGQAIIPPFPTGDIIKGSVTVDPDGFPIVYSGSRDGRYRAVAFDGDAPRELWALSSADATGPTLWNDDWDGSGLIVDDRLVIGGENSRLFVVGLDRGYDEDGRVRLAGEVLADVPGWDDELLGDLGDRNVSIESSVAIHDGVVYFANSGGLVQGWDLDALVAADPDAREDARTFRWWIGDDTDATVVIDPADGHLIVAAERERRTARSGEVGQVARLDPSRPDDPLVWSWEDPATARVVDAGVWGTPALWRDLVIVPTTTGPLVALDAATGEVRWTVDLGDHLWSSPVVVGDVLIQGDCTGTLTAFDLDPGGDAPTVRWSHELPGCIESTPAVWDGGLYVGTRAGQVHAVDVSSGI